MFVSPTLHPFLKPQTQLIYNAAVFDGTNDYMSITSNGVNDNQPSTSFNGTVNFFVKRSSTTGPKTLFILSDSGVGDLLIIRWAASQNLVITMNNPDGAVNQINILPGTSIPNDGNYHNFHLQWNPDEFDLTCVGSYALDGNYISASTGANIPMDWSTYLTQSTVGCNSTFNQRVNGGLARLWVSLDQSLPPTDFINPDNTPKTLGAQGEIGSVYPHIWLPFDGDSFATNQADGGKNYTVTGALGTEVMTFA